MKTPQRHDPELDLLIGLFYAPLNQLGEFDEVTADSLPSEARKLLAHNNHMTVTVEAFHSSKVSVEVLQTQQEENFYSREILLRRQNDNEPVQYGIVQLNFAHLADATQAEIVAQSAPLGRILIEHGVLRKVQLARLWRIKPSERLRALLHMPPESTCFGRTALIYCDGEPAVELLEVIPPSLQDLKEMNTANESA